VGFHGGFIYKNYELKGEIFMKIREFIEMYEKNPRIDIAKKLEVIPYIGIEYKRELARLVLDNCTSIVDGEIHIDSVERYLLFTISVIGMHTNLEFSYEEDSNDSSIDDYDALCKSGLLVKIIDTFKDDYASCQEVLNMMTTDRLQNNMTIEKKLYQFVDAIQGIFAGAVNNMVEKLEIDSLDGLLDENKLTQLYDLIGKR
jgi:hypothetical protein